MIFPSEACHTCSGTGGRNLPAAGRIIRRIRMHFGISQTAMARELGFSPQRVNDWEAGRRLMPVKITDQWESTCRKLGGPPELPESRGEDCKPDAPSPEPPVAEESAPAPSEPTPVPWIPRALREQGWTVIDGQVMRRSDEGSARRRR